jgi:hypothetical protein
VRVRLEYVFITLVAVIAIVLIALWTRPPYQAFYTSWLPYDVRTEIAEGSEHHVYASFHEIIKLIRRARDNPPLYKSAGWLARWQVEWTIVHNNSSGALHGVAATCLRYSETKVTGDLLACIRQAKALRE